MANSTVNKNPINLDPTLAQRYRDIIQAIESMMETRIRPTLIEEDIVIEDTGDIEANDEAIYKNSLDNCAGVPTAVKRIYFGINGKALRNMNIRKSYPHFDFPIEYHVRVMVYAMLSSQFEWEKIVKKIPKIDNIFHSVYVNYTYGGVTYKFHGFDIDYLLHVDPQILIDNVIAIGCGNLSIKAQMNALADNIRILQKIEKDHGSIDAYYNGMAPIDLALAPVYSLNPPIDLVCALGKQNGTYKLGAMAIPLGSEYLKNMGIIIAKPDRHVRRILCRLGFLDDDGYTDKRAIEAIKICHDMALACMKPVSYIDTLLWAFCATGYLQICAKYPVCAMNPSICPLLSRNLCPYGKKITQAAASTAQSNFGTVTASGKSANTCINMQKDRCPHKRFSSMGLKVGDEIMYIYDHSVKAIICSDNKVIYNNIKYKLTPLSKILAQQYDVPAQGSGFEAFRYDDQDKNLYDRWHRLNSMK